MTLGGSEAKKALIAEIMGILEKLGKDKYWLRAILNPRPSYSTNILHAIIHTIPESWEAIETLESLPFESK